MIDEELDKLYNPSIQDLELAEHQGKERDVVYLESIKKILPSLINQEILAEYEDLDEWDAYDIKDELKRRIRELRRTAKEIKGDS